MRAIGQLPDQASAKRFGDYLLVQGFPNQVEPEDNGKWTLWIHDDDHLAQAQTLLGEFLQHPADPKYRQATPNAREIREKEQQEEQAWQKRVVDRGSLWPVSAGRPGWVTGGIIVVCLAVALLRYMQGPDSPLIRGLYISDYRVEGDMIYYLPSLPEVRAGQIWRVVTPVFLHFTLMHLVFNLYCLLNLGGLIESRQGGWRFAIKVTILAVVSNLAQYAVGGPDFGGMSGVIYGLFGYIWLRGKLDPRSGFYLDPVSVGVLLAWFVICLTNLVGPIANMAHAAGLGAGLLWGFLAAKLNR
jgi:GlpG protein